MPWGTSAGLAPSQRKTVAPAVQEPAQDRLICVTVPASGNPLAGHIRSAVLDKHIARISDQIRALESELELAFARRRMELAYDVRNRVVHFEEQVLVRHRELRTRLSSYILAARPLMLVTAPLIYSLIIPFALLDLFVTVYQRVCFPVYGVPVILRADYMIFDRGHLAYLNAIEKLNCAYCSYANGVIAYVREVGSRTEQYWCPIKHALRIRDPHHRYLTFLEYGDADGYRSRLESYRKALRER